MKSLEGEGSLSLGLRIQERSGYAPGQSVPDIPVRRKWEWEYSRDLDLPPDQMASFRNFGDFLDQVVVKTPEYRREALVKKIQKNLPLNRGDFYKNIPGGIAAGYIANALAENRQMRRRDFMSTAAKGLGGLAGAHLLGSNEARPQTVVYIAPPQKGIVYAECDPNQEPDLLKYTLYFWKESDPDNVFQQEIPKDLMPFQVRDLDIGPVYHARATASNLSGDESGMSREEVVFVGAMGGNIYRKDPSVLIVNGFDAAEFVKSLGRQRGDPLYNYYADFGYDGFVGDDDLMIIINNWGRVQNSDFPAGHGSLVGATIIH